MMRIESEQLHYRARFETFPFDTQNPAMPKIVQVIWDWLRQKERRRRGWLLNDILSRAGAREAFFNGTLKTGYSGGLSVEKRTELRVDSITTDEDGSTLWAMEYDEPDGRVWFRHWHTRIGLLGMSSGSCVVNVKITYYTVPSYVGRAESVPFANVPNFVKQIVGLSAYQSCVGETILSSEEIYLTGDDFDEQFTSNLLSKQRELPLVLMVTDEYGATPVWDATLLAQKLIGMANVYVADWRNERVREHLRGLFPRGSTAFQYRCGVSTLRVYRPSVNLEDPDGWRVHPFFLKSRIDRYCEEDSNAFVDILSKGLGRGILKGDSDVLDISDVEWAKRQRDSEELARRMEAMRAKSMLGKPRDGGPDADERRIRALEDELSESRWFLREYEKENEGLRRTAGDLRAENDSLNGDNSILRYRLKAAEDRAESLEEESSSIRGVESTIEGLDHIPTSLQDLLNFAERLWPQKIIVLEEARKSARDFKGSLDEEWRIIKSLATVLWPICFEDDCPSGDLAEAYETAAGYELSLTETGITKDNGEWMRERKRVYRGREIFCIPHIKGKGKKDKTRFRLHYFADRDEKKIVVGHCGGHLTTASS